MSKNIYLSVQDDLYDLIVEHVEKNKYDYEGKITVFVRSCIIRRLRELGKIK